MTHLFEFPTCSTAVRAALTPQGVLRAGINLSNTLLVSERAADGSPDGVSPDMARAVAAALGVPCILVPYKTPGEVADAVKQNAWDIALIGAEPQRAATIAFTQAYAEIEASYCVRNDSPFHSPAAVDITGTRIITTARAAFTLWLERNITQAELVSAHSLDEARMRFAAGEADVLASLKSKLEEDPISNTRILEPAFMTVQQAIGCAKQLDAASQYLSEFVRAACVSGFVESRIKARGVYGLSAASGTR